MLTDKETLAIRKAIAEDAIIVGLSLLKMRENSTHTTFGDLHAVCTALIIDDPESAARLLTGMLAIDMNLSGWQDAEEDFCELRANPTPTDTRSKMDKDVFYQYQVQTAGDGDSWTGNGICFRTLIDAEQSAIDLSMRWTAVRDWRIVERSPEYVRDHKLTIYNDPIEKGYNHRVQL